jgi:hypothetical protein
MSMIKLAPVALALTLGLGVSCSDDDGDDQAAASPPVNRPTAKVVVISVDGLRPDAIRLAPAPAIMELAARGSYTWNAQTIRPSITLPSHTSMMTGTAPSEHEILFNDYRPIYIKETTPTALSLAKGAGARAVLVSGKEKFVTLAPPGGSDVFVWASGGDMDVAASAVNELQGGFGVALVHLPGTDDMGHAMGWMSPAYLAQVRAADAAVGAIVKSLPSDVTIILTADHGGSGNNHAENIPENTTIPWIIVGPGVRKNHELEFDVWTTDTAATVLGKFNMRLTNAVAIGRPVEEAFVSWKGTVESCGTVPSDAPVVTEQAVPEAAPAPAGGSVRPGHYLLTASTVYAGAECLTMPRPTNRRFKQALRVSAGDGRGSVMEHVEGSIGTGGGGFGFGGGVQCNVGLPMGPGGGGPGGGSGAGGAGPGGMPTIVMGPERRSRFRLATTGTKLERQRLCSRIVEPGTTVREDYTATADELLLFGELQGARDAKYVTVAKYTRTGD